SVALMDIDGNGRYEVAWNGAGHGLTLFDGLEGGTIFNEPHLGVVSQTGSDYPVFADVDQDGYGELLVASQQGVRVFGMDGYWGPARSLWNQHTYHITNINPDLTVPAAEPDSWADHNTFRAQLSPGQVVRGTALAAADPALTSQPGATVVYAVELTNTGNRLDAFTLSYFGNQWDVNQPITQIALAAGETRQILVEVTIPANAGVGQTDTVTIAAVSTSDPAASASVDLTTTATTEPTGSDSHLYLPIIQN
ncbi:MAG TPA: hypothetical protein VLT88_10890, partial [Desulfosarcina sp.]|nr:hypothetical protein [Desulfosarcina sp.]